jgi:WD40 repeat protein
MNTLQGHSDAVKAVQFDENQIVAGYDDSVKVYDLVEGSCRACETQNL